jgi:hypothetical protein
MSNISNKQNPFETDENLAPIFEASNRYQDTKKQALNSFKSTLTPETKLNPKATFNLSQFMSYNFSHFTKFSFAGLAVFTLLAGGLSAQALAPDTLKPTQLAQTIKDKYFSANTQSDGDPKIDLVADNSNAVKNLEGCNLNIKYPKIVNGKNLFFNKTTRDTYNSIQILEKNSASFTNDLFEISCSTNNLSLNTLAPLNTTVVTKKITAESLREKYGWFITNNQIESVEQSTSIVNGKEDRIELDFKYQNQNYSISFYPSNVNSESLVSGKDFQIQFNNNETKFAYPCIDSFNLTKKSDITISKGISESGEGLQLNNPDFYQQTETNSPYFRVNCFYNQDGKAWDSINTSHEPIKTSELPFVFLLKSTSNIKQAYVHPSEKSTFYYIELNDGKILEINYQNIEKIKQDFGISINL